MTMATGSRERPCQYKATRAKMPPFIFTPQKTSVHSSRLDSDSLSFCLGTFFFVSVYMFILYPLFTAGNLTISFISYLFSHSRFPFLHSILPPRFSSTHPTFSLLFHNTCTCIHLRIIFFSDLFTPTRLIRYEGKRKIGNCTFRPSWVIYNLSLRDYYNFECLMDLPRGDKWFISSDLLFCRNRRHCGT